MPIGFSAPFSASVSVTVEPARRRRAPASMPAGAFHTPRAPSVRAMIPATAPQGTNSPIAPSRSGSGARIRGK